ncbi:hypothetical protein ACLOJK_006914 [Asimina triloba]
MPPLKEEEEKYKCPITHCSTRDLACPGREVKGTESEACVAGSRSYEGVMLVSPLEGMPLPSPLAPFKWSVPEVYYQWTWLESSRWPFFDKGVHFQTWSWVATAKRRFV